MFKNNNSGHTPLTKLDINPNTVLEVLDCAEGQQTQLLIGQNTKQTTLFCHSRGDMYV